MLSNSTASMKQSSSSSTTPLSNPGPKSVVELDPSPVEVSVFAVFEGSTELVSPPEPLPKAVTVALALAPVVLLAAPGPVEDATPVVGAVASVSGLVVSDDDEGVSAFALVSSGLKQPASPRDTTRAKRRMPST